MFLFEHPRRHCDVIMIKLIIIKLYIIYKQHNNVNQVANSQQNAPPLHVQHPSHQQPNQINSNNPQQQLISTAGGGPGNVVVVTQQSQQQVSAPIFTPNVQYNAAIPSYVPQQQVVIQQQAVNVAPYQKRARNPLTIIDPSTNKPVNAAVALEKIGNLLLKK